MTRKFQVVALICTTVAAILPGCSLWAHLQSPERAEADPWAVYIGVLKGFKGDVLYVGTRESYAYFRIGSVFPTYYKTPACNTILPRVFDIGAEMPYVVAFANVPSYDSSLNCGR